MSCSRAAEQIKSYIAKVKAERLSREDFDCARKSVYGDAVSSLNSVDSVANTVIGYHFNGNELFKYIDAVANTTFEDVQDRLKNMLDVNNCTLSVVKNGEEK